MSAKKVKSFIVLIALCFIVALGVFSPTAVYAEISMSRYVLVQPTAEFVQGNTKEGVSYYYWTPTNVELIYYGEIEDVDKMTRLVVKPEDKDISFTTAEKGNRYELKIKRTTDIYIRIYTSEENEENNYLSTEMIDNSEFERKMDGLAPRFQKNSLLPTLKNNIWTIAFVAEDPRADSQMFWAQSGLKKVRIVDKYYPSENDSPLYKDVKNAQGEELVFDFKGSFDGEQRILRKDFSVTINNLKGDYYAELTDQVGNISYVSLLNIAENNQQYFETISIATAYSSDLNLNVTIRDTVSNALAKFLDAINRNLTGDAFNLVHLEFIDAMRDATSAYEKGVDIIVSVENKEYLAGTLDAEFTEKNYGKKVLFGDTLELRVTVALFDYSIFNNPSATTLAKTKRPTGVLRLSIKFLYNGVEFAPTTPVKVYMTLPKTYADLSLTYTSQSKESATHHLQSGAEWVMFEIGAAGTYDFFFEKQAVNLDYLWLLLLILPIGGAVAGLIIFIKRKGKMQHKSAVGVAVTTKNEVDFVENGGSKAVATKNVTKKQVPNHSKQGNLGSTDDNGAKYREVAVEGNLTKQSVTSESVENGVAEAKQTPAKAPSSHTSTTVKKPSYPGKSVKNNQKKKKR